MKPKPLIPHYEDGVVVTRIPHDTAIAKKIMAERESRRIACSHSRNTFWDHWQKEWVVSWNNRVHLP